MDKLKDIKLTDLAEKSGLDYFVTRRAVRAIRAGRLATHAEIYQALRDHYNVTFDELHLS